MVKVVKVAGLVKVVEAGSVPRDFAEQLKKYKRANHRMSSAQSYTGKIRSIEQLKPYLAAEQAETVRLSCPVAKVAAGLSVAEG